MRLEGEQKQFQKENEGHGDDQATAPQCTIYKLFIHIFVP